MSDHTATKRLRVTRRGFLIGTGVAGVGLVLGVALGRDGIHRFVAGQVERTMSSGMGGPTADPNAWFEIMPNDVVRFNVIKIEMGQGIHTALTQIAADELGARWEQMDVRPSSTAFGPPGTSLTGGSFSVMSSYAPLRLAAASMRALLLGEASNKMRVPIAELEAVSGGVRVKANPARRLTFGEIVDGVSAWPNPPDQPILKSPSEFTYIGKVVPRIDFENKLRGKPVYAYDIHRQGMLYGAVARAPTIEARMVSAAADGAETMPGVEAVVIDVKAGFAGVAARTREQARRAVQALSVQWDEGRRWNQGEIEALLVTDSKACTSVWRRGAGERALNERAVVAEYAAPFGVQAQLEPEAALVDPVGKEIFVSAQGLEPSRDAVANILGIDPKGITAHNVYLGGSFGRKMGLDSAPEAARLAKATGRPVHVGWTREEEMRCGPVRPAQRNLMRAVLHDGRISVLSHNVASGEVLFSMFPGPLKLIAGADPGIWMSGINHYRGIPHYETRVNTVRLPVQTGSLRGLSSLANTFAVESFIDELASLAGADPLQFRLDHLDDSFYSDRIRTTLKAAAELGGYGSSVPAGRARGIAATDYHDAIAAMVAEISIEPDGEITVHRASGAVDIGLVISPDGALAQAQGSIVMGLSSTLIEEMTVKDGVIEPGNFDSYPLITNRRTPEIEVRILGLDGKPRGMGEPMIGPVAAAVGNAFFNLTGRRLRRIPFTPARVRAALA